MGHGPDGAAPPTPRTGPGRAGWARRLAAPLAAAAIGVALAVGGLSLGLYASLACAVADLACPPGRDVGRSQCCAR